MTTNEESEDYTVDELLAMGEPDFVESVTDDLTFTARADSPYQDARVIERTQDALLEHLWQINGLLEARAEDPSCTAEKWGSMVRFRSLLLFAIQHTERRIYRAQHGDRKTVSLWKDVANRICDAIEGGPSDHLLDELELAFPTGTLTLRDWVSIRRAKEPARIPVRNQKQAA